MSRIGKKPVTVPQGVEISVSPENLVEVKGPKGTLTQQVDPAIKLTVNDGELVVERPDDQKKNKALHGLYRSLIANMVEGVTKGYEKEMEIVGTGYRAAKQGKKLTLNLGYSHPVEMEDPEGIETEVPANNRIIVRGIDKQKVGQYAALIRKWRAPEPYKGKGIKYKDEYIRRKVGKTGK